MKLHIIFILPMLLALGMGQVWDAPWFNPLMVIPPPGTSLLSAGARFGIPCIFGWNHQLFNFMSGGLALNPFQLNAGGCNGSVSC